MKVTLISTYAQPIALGLRYISAFLKANGHAVEVFFMRSKRDTARADFAPALLAELTERVRNAELIGLSLMTNTFYRAAALTQALREANIKAPIIWGGAHPAVAVDESLELADYICFGEGEHPMLNLANTLETGHDPTTLESLAFQRHGRVTRNPVAPLHQDLDEYPFPDYDSDTHWVTTKDGFEPASPRNLRGALHRYRIATTRGCPCQCTFCNNTAMRRIHQGKGRWVRKRSNENVIREIEEARARFPTIEAINIIDDLFFVRGEAEMEEFARLYEARVNLPLELDAFPNTITPAKVQSLARLPIALISMGIQSGSPDTLENIYKRHTPLKKIIAGINSFADHRVPAEYHYIINNPFEPDANRIETLRFAASHHRGPAILRIFPLGLYPGTPLYDRARREGVIEQRHTTAYECTYTGKTHLLDSQYLDVWLRVVLNLRNRGVPRAICHRVVSFVAHPWTRRALDRSWFVPTADVLYRIGRFITHKLIYQTFIRPFHRLRRKRRTAGAPSKSAPAGSCSPT